MKRLGWGWRLLHGVIVANFVANVFYCAYQVFVVLAPDGAIGPLWGAAHDLPTDLLVKRRLYAIEFWVTTGGLSVYLAITELLPRLLRADSEG